MPKSEHPATYGYWTVLSERSGGKGIGRLCLCKCVCGVEKEIPKKRLVYGSSKACGCQRGKPRTVTFEDLQLLASERQGECFSAEYHGHHEKHLWRCSLGHEWEATVGSVKQGSWCPYCISSRGEQFCREVLEALFLKPFPSSFPPWLTNPKTGRRLQLDGFCAELMLAFEYQGRQHFRLVPRYHKKGQSLVEAQERDEHKREVCNARDVRLIVIPFFPDGFDAREGLRLILEALDLDEVPYDEDRLHGFSFSESTKAEVYAAEVHQAAEEKGWHVETTGLFAAHQRITLSCPCGARWENRATDVRNKSTRVHCPECRKSKKRDDYTNRLKSKLIGEGFTLLSFPPFYSETQVSMCCKRGHKQKWRAARILSYPLFCRVCRAEDRAT
jgi:hypothetical protein